MKRISPLKILLAAVILLLVTESFGELRADVAPSDAANYPGKVVWDLKLANTMRDAIDNLKVIRGTYDDLVKFGLEVDMVIAVRAISKYRVSEFKKRDSMSAQSLIKQHNAILIDLLERPGMHAVGDASILDFIEDNNLRKRLKIVDNVYLELNKYHQDGYFIIPVY